MQTASAVPLGGSNWTDILACPGCNLPGPLTQDEAFLSCSHCGSQYPIFAVGHAEIPWLFPEPRDAVLEWQARFNGFLELNHAEQVRLRHALGDPGLSRLGRRRIEHQLQARERHRDQVSALVAPFKIAPRYKDFEGSSASRIGNKIPKNQGLLSYQANIFRDWSWNNGENEAQLRALESVLKPFQQARLGKVLTLGAGACRLAYDLHRNHHVDLSVVTDINPMMLSLASQVIHGSSVQLVEFPIAALNADMYAVKRDCCAPQSIEDFAEGDFEFLFADAMNPPFETASFDTVLTPWLIDVIPQSLRELIPRINHLLPAGGVWLNTGSLAFSHYAEQWNYSEDELLALVQDCGFEIVAADRTVIPYLDSPASSYGRRENVFTFSARKVCNTPVPPRFEYMPDWIRDPTQAVPLLPQHAVTSAHRLFQAQALGAIDGRRSLNDITELIASHYGLQPEEVTVALRHVMVEAYESGLTTGVLPQ